MKNVLVLSTILAAGVLSGCATPLGLLALTGGANILASSAVADSAAKAKADKCVGILKEADACTKPGELGFLLRREGLDTSYLAAWQWQHDRGEPLTGTVRGRGRAPDPIDPRAKQLEIENRRLQLKLARAEMAVTRRRKLSDLWRLVRRVPRRCARIWRFAVDWSFGGARVN